VRPFVPTGVLALAVALLAGCAAVQPAPGGAPFRFPADAFAFANETVWEYDADPATGRIDWRRRTPRPAFSLRCGSMARAARQFRVHARFDPSQPVADEATYARLVEGILAADARRPAAASVVVPGYPDLRRFSAAHEALLKAAIAGPRLSYLQRGNWRMIFPFPSGHQRRLARDLVDALARGWPPIVHLLRYPRLTVNHLVLVYAAEESPAAIRFRAYDPNDAAAPVVLTYDRVAGTFSYSPTAYFPGGPVKAYEVYRGLLY
jgi:hypothetical protein